MGLLDPQGNEIRACAIKGRTVAPIVPDRVCSEEVNTLFAMATDDGVGFVCDAHFSELAGFILKNLGQVLGTMNNSTQNKIGRIEARLMEGNHDG